MTNDDLVPELQPQRQPLSPEIGILGRKDRPGRADEGRRAGYHGELAGIDDAVDRTMGRTLNGRSSCTWAINISKSRAAL